MKNELVIIENEKAVTTSLKVAEHFNKRHKDVMKAVRDVLGSAQNFADGMFCESEYYDAQNKRQPMYVMNRDGFTLLVMGFTGKEAMRFKLDYIEAFNKMEDMIKSGQQVQKVLSPAEMLLHQAQLMVDHEKRLSETETKISSLEQKLNAFEDERKENGRLLVQERISDALPVPEMPIRDKVRKLVNLYSSYTNTLQVDVWRKIYDTLYYNYRVHVNGIKLLRNESKLEALERLGHVDKLYSIICLMCKNTGITTV